MRGRLRPILGLIAAVVVTVGVAAGAGAAALYLVGPNGAFSCVPSVLPAPADPIQRWIIVAGLPAVGAVLVGAFFALGYQRVLSRLIGLVLAVALAAATFYLVYLNLPADCRP